MAKCWTCGSSYSGWNYTCPSCQSLKELQSLRKNVESFHGDFSERLDYMTEVQREGFIALNNTLSAGFSRIASVIEWGFGEISWQLQQQTDILQGIDHTLKTPSETQANEWRQIAEELRGRGVLDESEKFYLKAIELNPLDYRIYVGLAETYLQSNKFDKARVFLEKSLPHAPKKEIDYKSYSYRLIGHICACEEDYGQAISVLQPAIKLSPNYTEGHYDYAQYCAQVKNIEPCLSSLQKAILAKPLYWYLAQKEQNFNPVRTEVEKLLSRMIAEASRRAKEAIAKSESALTEADRAISEAKQALIVSKDKAELDSSTIYENAQAKLKLAKDKVASGDYAAFLEAKPIAEGAHTLANNATNKAEEEREHYKKIRQQKVKDAWWLGCWLGFIFGILGGVGGCFVHYVAKQDMNNPATWDLDITDINGFFLGAVVGLIIGGISGIWKGLRKN
ncbi:tetratricopeptide repeat protein [Candidatus Poribacteria bacterium]|nr:tetratricopeptide repeat protein [Candidatus Poribacteria bacterium]